MRLLILIPSLLVGIATNLAAQDVEQYYKSSCQPCHTIGGGKLVGPDLKGVLDRKDREWLVEFIVDPNSKFDIGDAYADAILAESNGIRMANLGVDPLLANSLLDYIAKESGAAPSEPVEVEPLEPFLAHDAGVGQSLFVGTTSFQNNAPACNSCHTTGSLGLWGGGSLGPDLTHTIERLGGRRALSGWLAMPASATMAPVFKNSKLTSKEIDYLVAYLEAQNNAGIEEAPSSSASFFIAGVIGAIGLLALFGILWKDRYSATRIPLVEKSKQ
ncbi:MAG: hypothetical protein QGF46_06850 [Planctomycetota bacterium]|nr:hypothetical protein [Planctomycetota bacterium]